MRKEIRLRVSFFSVLCYNNSVCVTGKQVKLLYEPVAVRHVLYFFLPETPQPPGQAIGDFREGEKRNAESKYPDRNTPPQSSMPRVPVRRGKYNLKEKRYAKKEKKHVVITYPLYDAYCGYGIVYSRM